MLLTVDDLQSSLLVSQSGLNRYLFISQTRLCLKHFSFLCGRTNTLAMIVSQNFYF